MSITSVTFDAGFTATVHPLGIGGAALYTFADDQGTIYAAPAYLGQHDRQAILISLGTVDGTSSGYNLTGLRVDDWHMFGTLLCTGPDMTPGPCPNYLDRYPIVDNINDDTRQVATDLLSQIAQDRYDTLNP
ncbi:hypothetical protein ACOMD4_37270 [Streptomyces anulatus]|uniref:hypothetical protein n=1 Tax=Streptomyces anulatus TaxID=1892 RepID=UPI003B7E1365